MHASWQEIFRANHVAEREDRAIRENALRGGGADRMDQEMATEASNSGTEATTAGTEVEEGEGGDKEQLPQAQGDSNHPPNRDRLIIG